jgi:hypothetical protein
VRQERKKRNKIEEDASLNPTMFWLHHFIAGSAPLSAPGNFFFPLVLNFPSLFKFYFLFFPHRPHQKHDKYTQILIGKPV